MTSLSEGGKPRAAAVVPAHNEARTVGAVVRALKACPLISEVVVVSDGSTDATADEARKAGADQVLALSQNLGKGGAMSRGVALTKAEIIYFCDADFLDFRPENAADVIRPVLEGRYVMSVGLRDRGPLLTKVEEYLPFVGGERAMRREVFEGVPEGFIKGYQAEAALNWYCRVNDLPYGGVPSRGVRLVRKIDKVGFWKGVVQYAQMIWQVAVGMIGVRFHRKRFLRAS